MDCKIVQVEQGSDEWDALRRQRITASRMGDVMAKPGTKRHEGYKREIALELLGHENVEESPEWFRHGREQEPAALAQYAIKHDATIEHEVFLIHDDYDWLSCSPDALTIVDGEYCEGIEIKCRKLYINYRKAVQRTRKYAAADNLLHAIEPTYKWQIQTAMMLTGWDHWWYVNYYEDCDQQSHSFGDWRIGRCPIPRDQALIDEIECRCLEFMAECYKLAELEFAA